MKSEKANKQDALSILKKDHGKVQKIFQNFDKAEDEATRQKLVESACNELTIHTQVEEELFYPAARQVLSDGKLLDEASVEHESASQLIDKLQEMQPGRINMKLFSPCWANTSITILGKKRMSCFPK